MEQKLKARIDTGHTALHFAAQSSHLETVKCLVEKGAEIEAKTNQGSRPLHLAAQKWSLGNCQISG
jgi:ankyrin repeat protein